MVEDDTQIAVFPRRVFPVKSDVSGTFCFLTPGASPFSTCIEYHGSCLRHNEIDTGSFFVLNQAAENLVFCVIFIDNEIEDVLVLFYSDRFSPIAKLADSQLEK